MLRLRLLLIALFVIACGTTVSFAQDPLPVPGRMPLNEVFEDGLSSTRDVGYMTFGHTWGASNPASQPYWHGNGINYWIEESGPQYGAVTIVAAETGRGSCSISLNGLSVSCNLGSYIPSSVSVTIRLTLSYPDTADWAQIGLEFGTGTNYYYTQVYRPYAYDSNRVNDGGFEVVQPSSWKLRGGSKVKCNRIGVPGKPDKIFAYEGSCALQLSANTHTAAQSHTIADTLDGGDVLWIGYDLSAKSLDTRSKFKVVLTDIFGKTWKWKTPMYLNGTYAYTGRFFYGQVPTPTNSIKLIMVGGAGGKQYIDGVQMYVVHLEDLTSAR